MSTVASVTNMLVSGGSLISTGEAMKGVHNLMNQKQDNNNSDRLLYVIRPFYQMTLNLLGVKQQMQITTSGEQHHLASLHSLIGNIIKDVDAELEYARVSNNTMAQYSIYLCQGILAFCTNKFDLCRDAIEKCYTRGTSTEMSTKSADVVVMASLDVMVRFYDAMSCICMVWKEAKASSSSSENNTSKKGTSNDVAKQTKKYLEIADRALSKLETYAIATPGIVQSKICIIKAEMKVLGGQTNEALALYQTAMDYAVTNGNLYDRAVACERAGVALRVARRNDQALDYLEDSCGLYRAYGAAMKVNQITRNIIPDLDED